MTTSSASTSPLPQAAERRTLNFSAGPAVLPESVLREAQHDLWDIAGSGIGILEHSHRGKVFDEVLATTEAACREIAGIDDRYEVIFLQGGATTQFIMVPMNFLGKDHTANYLHTGEWTKKAIAEAKRFGNVHLASTEPNRVSNTCQARTTFEAAARRSTPGTARTTRSTARSSVICPRARFR